MIFDVINFLDFYNIDHTSKGKNTRPGWENICCPFCYFDDSYHGGFNLSKGYYNCWKCGHHSNYDIIKKLVPAANPANILKEFSHSDRILSREEKKTYDNKTIKIPGEKLQEIHKRYLRKRNFNPAELEYLFKLKGTNHLDRFNKFRIIAPVYFNGQVVSYQGRDITDKSPMRYKACPEEYEIIQHKHILYNIDNCNLDWVVLSEGITKVWRLKDNCCCTFGIEYTKEQLLLLSEREFKAVFVLFDPDGPGREAAEKICTDIDSIGMEALKVRCDFEADELTDEEGSKLMKKFKDKFGGK